MDEIDLFFTDYVDFDYNRSNSSPREFYRLCNHLDWQKLPNGSYPAAREEAHQKFRVAMVTEFNKRFGVDAEDISSWQGMCGLLGMDPIPPGIREMREAILGTHVNLADMLDGERSGTRVRLFNTKDALAEYTKREGRYFPKEDAYAGGLLKFLLREIHNSYQGSRGRVRSGRRRLVGAQRV